MNGVAEVPVPARSLESMAAVIGDNSLTALTELAKSLGSRLGTRVVWNINSTPRGGGVAEMLRSLVAYARGAGIDCRWATISGPPGFFNLTKRIHNLLHGSAGDGGDLGSDAAALYDRVSSRNASELLAFIRPGDVVIAHDPQTAGLITPLHDHGAHLIWRCHVGTEVHDETTDRAWDFLAPKLRSAQKLIFSRHQYVPRAVDAAKTAIITPTIDPLSPKNQPMTEDCIAGILHHVGIVSASASANCGFSRQDGSLGRVDRRADILRLGPPPTLESPLVVQVSRWDRLKDHVGVLVGFSELLDKTPDVADLVLAGPNVRAVADDPEGAEVFDEVTAAWRGLDHSKRQHVHLVNLPMHDIEENAAIVNALQRHARVVVQKSLREGFGLTVAEAMWKGRPVIASRIGGIQDQIEHGVSGLLLDDPADTSGFAGLLGSVLANPDLALSLGRAARSTVRDRFLSSSSLAEYGRLLSSLPL